ncbi:low specificity L-threonine aldolase [bacterium]|nr:low specificity L-threonine aldolase [bacterium]
MGGFGSDNHSGIHPAILQALIDANSGHAHSYGDDRWTVEAIDKFKEHFGSSVIPFFVFNGTGANVSSIASVCRRYESVVSASVAHLNVDECGSLESTAGLKLMQIATIDGKLRPEMIEPLLAGRLDQHRVQPRVISISQPTELGTVYTLDELRKLAVFAHKNGMLLQMDGARIANAVVHLSCSFKEMTVDIGIDIVSFGGTKNGMVYGEAVLFFDEDLAKGYEFFRKQSTQLASKMRFIAAQFSALLSDNLWYDNASHANEMAQLLLTKASRFPWFKPLYPVESNAIFVQFPDSIKESVREKFFFYDWDAVTSRLMTSFDTTEDDINGLIATLY